MSEPLQDLESRVLLLAPTPRDGAFTVKLFDQVNIHTHVCRSLQELCEETQRGAAMLILGSEIDDQAQIRILSNLLHDQPPWSDLPVLCLVSPKATSIQFSENLPGLNAITFLKRPIEVVALLTAVKSGLRDRQRQYAVREHLIEREEQSQALIEADRRKDEFLATLAHELRNPLSPLRSGIDLLKMEDDDNQEHQAILQMMDRQLRQMVRLVDDLLDVSRITRDKLVLSTDLVEIQAVIRTSVETTRQLINNSRITLKSEIPLEPLYVRGDHTRLTQVVSNLLNNAVKYSEDTSEIQLRVEAVGDEVVISVQDTGIGIPKSMLGKVFDMFTQVDSSLTRSRGGLGIGLTLVRRIVELHGGRVSATSDGPGKGSTFCVVLKRERPVALKLKKQSPNPEVPSVSRRVLIVDDTRAARVMLAKLLRKLGHEVYQAASAQHALAQIQSIRPDVIISDIGMPEMDGYQLAKKIRSLGQQDRALLVALTGYGQDADRMKAIDAGFDVHLVKPVSYSLLQRTLNSAKRE